MNNSAILRGKIGVVFGAGGSIGAAVAKEFAAEGAEVFLSGRTQSNVEALVLARNESSLRSWLRGQRRYQLFRESAP